MSDLRVEGRHAWVEGPVRVVEGSREGIVDGPVLVVAPHPDDAEIAAYGLYRNRSAQTHILVVTTGDRGNQYRAPVERPGGWTAWLRRFDGLTAPLLAGVPSENVASLDLSEGDLSVGAASPGLSALQGRLEETLARVRPVAVVVPHPALESHAVHLAVTLATLRAMRAVGSEAEALFCLIHVPRASRYPLGPRESAIPLPPCTDGGVHFERLVAQRLSPLAQTEKLFALDAHHDLRPGPAALTPLPSLVRLARERWRERTTGVQAVASRDYLRRAARPYEIFLAVSAEGLPDLLERLEARLR